MSFMENPVDLIFSLNDEFQDVEHMNIGVPECEGLSLRQWVTKCVTLYNNQGILVGEGTCHSVNSDLVLGANGPLGDMHVGIHISKTHSKDDIAHEQVYSLVAWPIKLVHCRGASLHDHDARDTFNRIQASLQNPASTLLTRPYTSIIQNLPHETSLKAKELLTQDSFNTISSKVCCSKNCVQPFPREKICAFHERMYQRSSFKFRAHIKTDVHKSTDHDSCGRKMVIVEGINVCMRAWMLIAGVPEATFYRYQTYAKNQREARDHGNLGLLKPKKHTEQAAVKLKCILDKEADHMPHKTRTLKSGDKVVSMILSTTFQGKDQIPKINEANVAFGLKKVSTSNLSKIRSTKFPEYDVKKLGDNFARYSTCDKLQELRKGDLAGFQSALKWLIKLDKQLAIARTHRDLYYANRYISHTSPQECLTIMHDKMDHAKTTSPIFSHKSKETDGLVKLPVSVTGMIAHGHGDVCYAHYGLDIFPHDSNYTIGLMAKLLRDLKEPPKSSFRQLFVGSGLTPLFCKVLKGAEMCEASLPPVPEILVPATSLLPILNVQMDNATGDNKNRYVFCFWSLLVANKIFREVYVNFMIVGHTHDNIDALFERWSMLLKKENFPTIPTLMKSFMDVESIPTIPHLIEEVPNFKGFIAGAFVDGNDILVGHTKLHQVKFYLDSNGTPVMKYKLLCTNVEWLGEDGRGIKLWKEDSKGRSMWPHGVPLPVPPKPMRGVENVMKGISRFVKYWENLYNADVTGECRRRYEHLVYYWRDVRDALQEPITTFDVLKDGFRPTTGIQANAVDRLGEDGEDREEFGEDEVYVGPLRGRPQPSFRVCRDLFEGYFVALRLVDGNTRPIWIAKALSDPNCNPEKSNCVLIQYFHPTLKSQDVQDFYTRWDSEKGLCWKVDIADPPIWEETNALMIAWKFQIRKDTRQCLLKIPTAQIEIINHNLASYV